MMYLWYILYVYLAGVVAFWLLSIYYGYIARREHKRVYGDTKMVSDVSLPMFIGATLLLSLCSWYMFIQGVRR